MLLAPMPVGASRPLDTEDTGTVDPGKAELELSGDLYWTRESRAWSTRGVLSFGVVPRLEARFESTLLLLDRDDGPSHGGVGDSLVGFKYRLYDETPAAPAVLAALTLRLPTGDETRGLGAGGVDPGVLVAISKRVSNVIVTGNVGYVFVTRDRALDLWILAGSVEYLSGSWSLVGEVVGKLTGDRLQAGAVLRAGAVYAVTNRIRLDGAVGFGVGRRSGDVLLTLGATIGLF